MKCIRFFFSNLALVAAAVIVQPALSQVPPPPLSENNKTIISKIIVSFQDKDLKAYAELLDRNVRVFRDGEQISDNRDQWVKIISEKFQNSGIIYRIGPIYAEGKRILTIEYFNSTMSWNNSIPADCCIKYDAVAYDVSNGLITKIQILSGGDKTSGL